MPDTTTIGSVDSELRQLYLGVTPLANVPPSMPTSKLPQGRVLPFLAHLYNQNLVFKKTMGNLTRHVILKSAINSFHQSSVIELTAKDVSAAAPANGDIVRLTLDGPGSDGAIKLQGFIDKISDWYDDPPKYALTLVPLGAELGDTAFDRTYNNVDVAQMVRDAVDLTAHLNFTAESIPNTGIIKSATFSKTNSLEVLDTARLMCGVFYWWYVDANNVVWFRSYNTTMRPQITLEQGVDFTYRHFEGPSTDLRNYVIAVGGVPAGGSAPVVSVYSDPTSQAQYGLRVLTPPYVFPQVTDKPTLDAIVATVGSALNRIQRTVEIMLPNRGSEILLGVPIGTTIRFWEDQVTPRPEMEAGAGAYSPNYVVLEVHVDGPKQRLIVGDVPYNASDLKSMIERILARTSVSAVTYTPAALNVVGTFTGTGGLESSNVGGAARWVLDATSLRASDGTSTNYGAPSGAGITVEIGANGSAFFSGTIKASTIIGTTISGGTISGTTIQGGQIQPIGGIPGAGVAYMLIDMINQRISVYDTGGVQRVVVGNY